MGLSPAATNNAEAASVPRPIAARSLGAVSATNVSRQGAVAAREVQSPAQPARADHCKESGHGSTVVPVVTRSVRRRNGVIARAPGSPGVAIRSVSEDGGRAEDDCV